MRRAKYGCLALAALALLLLGGCTRGGWPDDADLLQMPARPQATQQLLQTVRGYLGENATLKYPLGGATSTPFFWWDADGDGAQSLLVLYQNTAKSKNVQLAVLRPTDGGWYAAHMDIEGAAGETDGVQLLQLSADCSCLLVGYQETTGQDWMVCLYQWQDGALHERARLTCQRYTVLTLEDGSQRLAVVQRNATHGLLQLRLLGAGASDAAPATEFLQEQAVVTLDSRFVRCVYLSPDRPQGTPGGLVMDFLDSDNRRLAEVMAYSGGRLIRCYTADTLNIPNFSARSFDGLSPRDADGDGVVEVPRVDNRVLGPTATTRFYLISWYAVDTDGERLRAFGLLDRSAGYLMGLPLDWHSRVMLQEEGDGWSLRRIDTGAQLLSWRVSERRAVGSDYRLLGDLGEEIVSVRFEETLSEEEKQAVTDSFVPLYD